MTHSLRSLLIAIVPFLPLISSCALAATSREFGSGRRAGIVQSELVREASGIVASRQNPGVLWVHNDSGDSARLFAINTQGRSLGVCNIRGAIARDWEDIAIGPGPGSGAPGASDPRQHFLYLGDIGDNLGKYPDVTVYRLPEPKVSPTSPFGEMTLGPPEAIRLTYPDGPRDAETLLVDPLTRDIFIISKREIFSRVYRAAWPQSTTQPTRMERVATLPWGFATAGDVSPDGRRVIVRGMFNASLWVRPPGEGTVVPLWRAFSGEHVQLPLLPEPQGEGICFDAKGTGYFTIGEESHPPLHYFGPAEPNTPRS